MSGDSNELESRARERLPRAVYEYYAGGAGEGATVAANRAAFERVRLCPRVLTGADRPDLSITALGQRLSMPIAVAPTALQRLAHPDGELATARAAADAETAMILSTMATASVEEVAAVAAGPLWFQLYLLKDRGATRALVERAVAAGARALVLTVDAVAYGQRPPGAVTGFALPREARLANLDGLPGLDLPAPGSTLRAYFATLVDASVGWDDVAWLRSLSSLPLVLKGILAPDDARLAAEHGVDAIVVSNHGGRVLDGEMATLDALPGVADAAAGRLEVWMDGGVRSGTDVLKALALGARLVLVGRPILWGLAAGGEAGVREVLLALRDELETALAACGCRSPRDESVTRIVVR